VRLADPSNLEKFTRRAANDAKKNKNFLNDVRQFKIARWHMQLNCRSQTDKLMVYCLRQCDGKYRTIGNETILSNYQPWRLRIAFVFGSVWPLAYNRWCGRFIWTWIAAVLHEGDYGFKRPVKILHCHKLMHKLARFGGEMTASTGRIYYANFLWFDKIKSLHLSCRETQVR